MKLLQLIQGNIILYQTFVLCLFLVGITITETMTVTLSVYIVLCMLPFIFRLNWMKDSFTFLFVAVSLTYLVYGILCQNMIETISSFCGRSLQFIALLSFYKILISYIEIDIRKVLIIAIVFESVLGVYMFFSGIASDTTNAMFRLVAGHQPVGGNFSIAILPLIIWAYFHDEDSQKKIIKASFILMFWIALSGTRGYILIWLMSMLPIYMDFFKNISFAKRGLFISITAIIVISYLGLCDGGIFDFLYKLLRLGGGTGIRGSENSVAIETFLRTTLPHQLLGMGLGGTAAEVPGYAEAVSKYMNTTWSYNLYISRVGASFHNLYGNILLMQGLTGCVLIVGIFIWGWSKVAKSKVSCNRERICLYLFWVGFFLMNYFRWSCDCGVSEMAMLGIVLTKLENESI